MTKRELFINFFKDSMRARTLHEILAKELREAYLSKLNAETAQEYAQSIVSYNEARIVRINKRILDLGEEQ